MALQKFFNRELSWIEFNARVLHESCRKELPLLERLKFSGIVTSNFDEFFQVRVASIKRLLKNAPHTKDASGFTPSSLLKAISNRCHELTAIQDKTLTQDILPSLAKQGIAYIQAKDFTPSQKAFTEDFFNRHIFPLLTPLRTDGSEFPRIGNLNLHVAFLLSLMSGVHAKQTPLTAQQKDSIIAIVQVPSGINRIVWLPNEGKTKTFTLLDDIITLYGSDLFPGYKTVESMIFKIVRDADVSVDEDAGNNFIQAMKQVLIKRESSFAVRMECNVSSQTLLSFLTQKLNLTADDIYKTEGIVDASTLKTLTDCDSASAFLFPEWKHFYPTTLNADEPLWQTISQRDILLHVPYESYDPVLSFIQNAADDPDVLAIKMTLYRTGSDSPIVRSLIQAARKGKQVTVFVELKARFDEQQNMSWARELENSGAIVIYGIVNLKVHAKVLLVMRKERDGIKRYVHLSTGNYNANTAQLYQDISLFTAKEELAQDVTLFFNTISGYSAIPTMHHLYMAPVTLKSKLLELIEREIQRSTKERPGRIIAKMNSLCHPEVIEQLYKASQAGVEIILNVRGICTLVPGVKGLSENIKVVSIVDRYLEHSRIFYFYNGGKEELYLSSADWMERNLDRRIELMFPVTDRKNFLQLKELLSLYFDSDIHHYSLKKDGTWKVHDGTGVQEIIYKKYKKKNDARRSSPKLDIVVRRKD